MTDQVAQSSPSLQARTAGLLYLIVFVMGPVTLFIDQQLIVSRDAAVTAHNILASEQLFRLGITANLIATVCYLGVTALLYELFKPVSRSMSLLAAFFSLVALAVAAGNAVDSLTPLAYLSGGHALSAFTPEQLQALASTALKLQAQGANISLLFFGFYCASIGYLIAQSTFLPRILGLLMVVAGLGWGLNAFATILSPAFASSLAPFALAPGALGEGALTLWLLLFGVNASRWNEQAIAAGVLPVRPAK